MTSTVLENAAVTVGGVQKDPVDITGLEWSGKSSIRKMTFGCGVMTFGDRLFYNYDPIREIYFMGNCPTNFGTAFAGDAGWMKPTKLYKRCIYIPRGNPTWDAILNARVPWDEVPEEGRQVYYDEYGADAPALPPGQKLPVVVRAFDMLIVWSPTASERRRMLPVTLPPVQFAVAK